MGSVKTAISIQRSLFEEVEALAQEMDVSRSRLFVMAVEEFIHRHQNRQLLEKINAAYADALPEEPTVRRKRRQQHRQMVKGQW